MSDGAADATETVETIATPMGQALRCAGVSKTTSHTPAGTCSCQWIRRNSSGLTPSMGIPASARLWRERCRLRRHERPTRHGPFLRSSGGTIRSYSIRRGAMHEERMPEIQAGHGAGSAW